ncbi:MAG: hypothetical protein ACI868_001556, partial [Granulosicoccus sp.]
VFICLQPAKLPEMDDYVNQSLQLIAILVRTVGKTSAMRSAHR